MPDQEEAQNDIVLCVYSESAVFVGLCKMAMLRAARLVLQANGGLIDDEHETLDADSRVARLGLAKRILAKPFPGELIARIVILDEGVRDRILVEDPANGGSIHHPTQRDLCKAIRDAWTEMSIVGTFRVE